MTLWMLLALPALLLASYGLYRRLIGRSVTRHGVDMVVGMLLLFYFSVTAGLGIFWVARQELPVFDWHYLFGYVTLALVAVHVALNWAAIMGFLRKLAPSPMLAAGGRRWRPGLRALGWAIGLGAFGLVCFWLGRQQSVNRIEITTVSPAGTVPTNAPTADQGASGMSSEDYRATDESLPGDRAESRPAPVMLGRQMVKSDDRHRSLADHYHEQTKHTRRSVMGGGALDFSRRPSVFKGYPDAERIELPEPPRTAGLSIGAAIEAGRRPVAGFAADAISLTDLSTMLSMTNGVTSTLDYPGAKYYLRAAPSAGALYPTVTYAIIRQVEGLPPGLYHYAVKDHALHRLGSGDEPAAALASLVPQARLIEQAPVTFVFTSVFFRSSWKYKERAYRYCGLDAGHLAVQTLLAAEACGCGGWPIGRFDDAGVNQLLGVDDTREGAMLILPVGRRSGRDAEPRGQRAFVAAPREIDSGRDPLIFLMHGRTCLAATERRVGLYPVTQPSSKGYADRPVIALPAPTNAGEDLYDAVRRRRSRREWIRDPLVLSELSVVLHHAFGVSADGGVRDPSVEGCEALQLYLVAQNVADLAPGLYHYQREGHALVQLREEDLRSRIQAASLFQDAVGNAHATLIMTADQQRVGLPDGDRGYRYANLDAGMLGGRVYLQATGMNLGCCGIGAYFDDEVSDLLGVLPEEELVVYLAAIGVPEAGQ